MAVGDRQGTQVVSGSGLAALPGLAALLAPDLGAAG
jgi:hypothetical protein